MRDEFAVVATLGVRLDKERTGWRDTKALVLLVAQQGQEHWSAAASLADALGVGPDTQEAIYREVYQDGDPVRDPHQRRRKTGTRQ